MGCRADEGGEEAVQEARHPADDECSHPGKDRREQRRDGPQREPEEVRDDEQQPERDEKARAAEVVPYLDGDGMDRQLRRRLDPSGRRERIAVGQQQRVCGGLGPVADRIRRRVAHAARHAAAHERGEPPEHRDGDGEAAGSAEQCDARPAAERGRAAEGRREEQRRKREHEPEAGPEPSLARRGADLDVDGILGRAGEARIRRRREREVRREVDRVPDVRGEEVVQRPGGPALEQDGEPDDEHERERRHAVQRHPDEMRQRENEPEQDREAPPREIVGDDEANGALRREGGGHRRILRVRVRRIDRPHARAA
jgi:hypothetical protein